MRCQRCFLKIALVTRVAILVIIFWNFTIFQYRSDSPQAKRNLISSMANLVYDFPHELPNDLRLYEIRRYQKSVKHGWIHSLMPSLPSRNQTLPIAVKKHTKMDTKLFFYCPVLPDLPMLFQIFCPGFQFKCLRY